TGDAFVTGFTMSTTFPTTPGAFQTTCKLNTSNSCSAGYVTKLDASGTALIYSTYLAGSGADSGFEIAVDSLGSAYVAGNASSTDFPLVNPLQSTPANGFVAKLKPDGSGLVYSTYLGGSNQTLLNAIAVDSTGAAYLAGETNGYNFTTTPGAYQSSSPINSGFSGFVAKIDQSGTFLDYATFLSGKTASVPWTSIL